MADVPVRRERPERGSVLRRGESPSDYFALSPWSMMRRFNEEMDRWFGGEHEGAEMGMWSPKIDVRERDNNLVVSADLPGLNKEDVKLEVTDEGLCIRGERKREHEEKREGYYRSERSYGTFSRIIPLPEGANVDQAKAEFNNGVLEVTVPIPESARRRREIPIGAAAAPKTRTSGGGT